jgi:hypothetical protein
LQFITRLLKDSLGNIASSVFILLSVTLILVRNQRGDIAIVLIVIIVVAILGVGASIVLTQKPSSNQTDTSTPLTDLKEKVTEKLTDKVPAKTTFSKVGEAKLIFTGGYADATVTKLDNGSHIMYVNRFGPTGSGYHAYTSTDGLEWKEYSGEVLPSASTGRVVKMNNGYRFYYPGLQPIKPSDPPATIKSSFSTDGYTFKIESGVRITPKSDYYLEGPTVFSLKDGSYRMYFNENKTATAEKREGSIWGASSIDGLVWTRDEKVTIESDPPTGNMPTNWPQALHPFVLTRADGSYVMFYNSHSQVYAAESTDGLTWTKLGDIKIKGADVDGYYLDDTTIRLYYGDFSPTTSGVIYTIDIKETR